MTQTPLREIIAKAYAHKSVGDPHAIDVNGRPRWEWYLDDADKFLSIFGHLFADRAPFITDKMAADAAMVLNKALTHGNLFGVSLDMLQAALLTAPTDNWRPIDTAPKNGTSILLGGCTWGPSVRVGEWAKARFNRNTRDYDSDWCSGSDQGGINPTHWQPLPVWTATRVIEP